MEHQEIAILMFELPVLRDSKGRICCNVICEDQFGLMNSIPKEERSYFISSDYSYCQWDGSRNGEGSICCGAYSDESPEDDETYSMPAPKSCPIRQQHDKVAEEDKAIFWSHNNPEMARNLLGQWIAIDPDGVLLAHDQDMEKLLEVVDSETRALIMFMDESQLPEPKSDPFNM